MKIQIQAGQFYITGKESELTQIEAVLTIISEEMGNDLSVDNASEGGCVVFECGYRESYYTIKEVKEMFQHAKKGV
jgi:hypothetical protein